MTKHFLGLLLFIIAFNLGNAQSRNLKQWKFSSYDDGAAFQINFNDSDWRTVEIPHDWAAEGPFDFNNDLRFNTIVQNGETKPVYRTGRSGALPIVGVGWYRTHFTIKQLKKQYYELLFDGAMSNAKVYVNGNYVGERPFGYISFYFDISKYLKKGDNVVAVRLENFNGQTRWYSGAGLYRKVQLQQKNKTHIKTWGTFVTTSKVTKKESLIRVRTEITAGEKLQLRNTILDTYGNRITKSIQKLSAKDSVVTTELNVKKPKRWSVETPNLYSVKTELVKKGKVVATNITLFGIRTIRFEVDGFYLNDKKVRFKGVNMHHDLGPSGAAFYPNLFERQLKKLKEMGVNAIRFSHNPPAPEALDLCDRYGFLAIDEAFDEWEIPKVENGYAKHFKKWAKKDLTSMIRRDRNHPAIIMWSIGNEIMEQYQHDPNKITSYLHAIVKSVDTTRATTCGFNNAIAALQSGMAQTVDVAGFNYKAGSYHLFREKYPTLKFYASETGGALSVRDTYKFPVTFEQRRHTNGTTLSTKIYKDAQPGNYEVTMVPWGYPAFKEFASQAYNKDIMYGEFVWTGYDYLGEPAPYNKGTSRTSHFGPIDFVGLPKDKFYAYKSEWNTSENTLHFFPHWNWGAQELKFPVVCYANYAKAELFVNGKSYGMRTKEDIPTTEFLNTDFSVHGSGGGSLKLLKGHAFVWEDVTYEKGEAKVIAYNKKDEVQDVLIRKTAAQAYSILIEAEELEVAEGEVAVFIITAVDAKNNWQPEYQKNMRIEVSGAGKFLASGNGNPANLQQLNKPERTFFKGKAVVYVKAVKKGTIKIKVRTDDFVIENTTVQVK